NEVNALAGNAEVLDHLIARKLGHGHDGTRLFGGTARQPSPPNSLAEAKPLRVRHEREIVDRDHDRNVEHERRGVCRGEEEVEMISASRGREAHLFPPNARSAANDLHFVRRVRLEADVRPADLVEIYR